MGASLATDWLARVSPLRAADLTNPDPPTSSTAGSLAPTGVNQSQLALAVLAVTDANGLGDFQSRTGYAYDGTQSAHVNAGVLGVTFFLTSYRELPGSKNLEAAEKLYAGACARVAQLLPAGSSQLTPTPDRGTPDFDRSRFGDITLQAPGSSNAIGGIGGIGNLEPGLFS